MTKYLNHLIAIHDNYDLYYDKHNHQLDANDTPYDKGVHTKNASVTPHDNDSNSEENISWGYDKNGRICTKKLLRMTMRIA